MARCATTNPNESALNKGSRGVWIGLVEKSIFLLVSLVLVLAPATQATALTPNSPEVRKLINLGVKSLEKNFRDNRLGALCVAGLAIYKSGQKDHPLVKRAMSETLSRASKARELDMYSHGLAVIFLSEVGGPSKRGAIEQYLNSLIRRQKPHGGWGYDTRRETLDTGDTSQTQYIALAMWQAHQAGIPVPRAATEKMLNWLVSVQDPAGSYGYQGKIASGGKRARQDEITDTLTMASLGSLMIGADLFGMLEGGADDEKAYQVKELPKGVSLAGGKEKRKLTKLSPADIEWSPIFKAMRDGDSLMDSDRKLPGGRYGIYRLYTMERYQSFREFRDGIEDEEPDWYQKGYEYLLKNQEENKPGVWSEGCGDDADTAFAVLFLLRSTQKSLRARIGQGVMLSGRGLPRNVSNAKIVGGKVVAEIDDVEIGGLLSLIEGDDADRLDDLADNPTAIKVDTLTRDDLARLEQVLRNGSPSARAIAANALGKVSSLDHVPALLFAMTDPDRRVALAARDALRFTSRRPDGFGLKDDYSDSERYAVHQRWKRWYLSIRPNARLEE